MPSRVAALPAVAVVAPAVVADVADAAAGSKRAIALAAALILAAACACSFFKPGGSAASTYRSPIQFTVENKSSQDLVIYVRHDGRTERLERVNAARTTKLVIPSRMISLVGDMILIGERPAFGGRIASQSVTVHECERLEWTIEAQLSHSVLAVVPVDNCK